MKNPPTADECYDEDLAAFEAKAGVSMAPPKDGVEGRKPEANKY